jgi:prolipoprotein diacylglyceryltransferase
MSERYPLILVLSIALGFLWLPLAERRLPPWKQSIPLGTCLDGALAATAMGVLGARLAFVLGHLAYFRGQPFSSLYLWDGGLHWAGGLLGALLGLATLSRWARVPFWPLAASLSPPGMLVAFGAWLGCTVDRCAYGRPLGSHIPWLEQPDLFGQVAARWPVQALGALLSLAILLILLRMRLRQQSGMRIALTGMALLASLQLGLSFLRGDPVPLVGGMRADALGALAVGSTALLLAVGQRAKRRIRRQHG